MKIVIRAANRTYPDNVGDYLWESYKAAGYASSVELVRSPTEILYKPSYDLAKASREEVSWVNEQDADAFLYFTDWGIFGHGGDYRQIPLAFKDINCKKIFCSREDPNHFESFLGDCTHADIIGTCAEECVPKYQEKFPDKKVICLPMAVSPDIFYSPVSSKRHWDIVFLGNRYKNREVRTSGEQAVIIEAAKWAIENGKNMGVWGREDDAYGWSDIPEIYETEIYRGRVDRLAAASIYKTARVALSISSNDNSLTMAPNRIVQAACAGCDILAYTSKATEWQTRGHCAISTTPEETRRFLDRTFSMGFRSLDVIEAQSYVMKHHTFYQRLQTILETLND